MNILTLFDVDKTLVKGSGGHSTSFSEAFKKVYGINTTIDIINHDGMTDQQIIIDVLKKNGLDEQAIKSRLKDCMKAMIDHYNKTDNRIIVLDGVQELLEELNKQNILMGLVTGNLEPIARGKLRKAGLNDYFRFGGFGSDDIDRSRLVMLAIKRAEDKFGFQFNNNVFLFGDTPRDVEAGKEAKTITVGVATGRYTREQLKESGADFILNDLKDTKNVLKIIYKPEQ